MYYRPEIDGLRALAVVPVIFFHAGFELFRGGFVGVDIFFVISGYLITKILLEDIKKEKFDVVGFYERRARRILPALFFVMLISIPFAWMWMLPDPLENFGQSLVSTSLFSNNILLMLTSTDYWELKGEFKPMLHTWSLAVEEQYYLIFPIFLAFFWKYGESKVFWIILAITAISLILSEWGWRNSPLVNFYNTFSRVWELLAGSISAFLVSGNNIKKNNILSLIGLIAVMSSIFFYDENISFPSLFTLVPVIGTVLLILYADKKTLAAKILANKVFVGVGLISYSLYLWHQPILAFSRVYQKEALTDSGSYLIILITFLLAIFSWKFVERPFRNKSKFSSKQIFSLSVLMMIGFISVGLYFDRTNGVPNRIFLESNHERSTHEIKIASVNRIMLENIEINDSKNQNILIFGDSFAADLAYLIEYKDPTINYTLTTSGPPENTICMYDLWDKAKSLNVSSVLFAYDEGFDVHCIDTAIKKANKQGIEILFIGGKHFGYNLNWLARLKSDERKYLCQPPVKEAIEIDYRDSINIPKENYFSFFNTFLDNDDCFPITNSNGELLSSDRRHFTISGLEFFADKFFQNQNVLRAIDIK